MIISTLPITQPLLVSLSLDFKRVPKICQLCFCLLDYLATVVKESSVRWGISFDYLEPFNEPNSEWWKSTMSVQEGCGFSPAAQAAFMPYLVEAMKRQGVWNKTKVHYTILSKWRLESDSYFLLITDRFP